MPDDKKTAKPADDVITEPVTEPAEPVTEPAVEPGKDQNLDELMTPVEPEPGTEPPAEPVVEPEPPAAEPAVTEPVVDVTQSPEYQKLLAENQQMNIIRDIVLGEEDVYKMVEQKLQTKTKPVEPQTTEPQPLQMPAPPQYANMEDLSDPNSETSKWFAQRDQVMIENAVNATTAAMDKRFTQNEQQRAESERQTRLTESFARVKETVNLDEDAVNKAMDVWNNPNNYDLDTTMKAMILAGHSVLNKQAPPTPPTPAQRPDVTTTKQKPPSTLPNYSDVGGTTPEPETLTEDEYLNKDLMASLEKEGRRVVNRK
jgi:hypothetical protein